MTFDRIKGWYETFDENVYFSYSGGKDSTVLLEMVAVFCKEYGYTLYVAFCDTGLEYPEIRIFAEANAKRIAEKYGINMVFVRLRPDMNFRDVLIEYGYPVISKEVSKIVYGARHSKDKKQSYINKLKGLNPDGSYSEYKQRYKKYEILLQAPFEISNRCCVKMKEQPAMRYEMETGKKPIVATMADESKQRLDGWCKTGCNAFDFGFAMDAIPLKTTGCDRTGCIFCGYGCHLNKGISRFQRLKETHEKLYNYCIGGGEFNERGMWQPSKRGLGMGFVFDWLNEQFGDDFIRYK
jgi:hypothetical protein